MAFWVQKYGGSSLASPERIKQVAKRIIHALKAEHRLVIVLSAMQGDTDRLLGLLSALSAEQKPSREYAAVLASGENIATNLMAYYLQAQGYLARAVTGAEIGILTTQQYVNAQITQITTQHLQALLNAGYVPIVAGFQGVNAQFETTTLGRGGSDTTAVALAAALQADECQIYTDVDGIYTADPRIVPRAQCIKEAHFPFLCEFTAEGAKVLQKRSVALQGKGHVDLRVLSSLNSNYAADTGSLIHAKAVDTLCLTEAAASVTEAPEVIAFAHQTAVARIFLSFSSNQTNLLIRLFDCLSTTGISFDMLAQEACGDAFFCSFVVERSDYVNVFKAIEGFKKLDQVQILSIRGEQFLSKISIVGTGLRHSPEFMQALLRLLAEAKIPLQMFTTSELKISLLLHEKYLQDTLVLLHERFVEADIK